MSLLAGDYRLWHFPLANLLAESLRAGEWPLWSSNIGCGFPVFAEGQIALLYPFSLLYWLLPKVPVISIYNFGLIAHYWLAGCFFYVFARRLNLSLGGSLAATAIFLFGSCQGGFSCNANSQRVLVWFPLVLLLVDRFVQKEQWIIPLWVGALVGTQFLAGHPQTFIYATGFSLAYYIWRWFGEKGINKRSIAVFAAGALIAGVLAALIALPQILATAELLPFTHRKELPEAFAYIGSLTPQALLTILLPFLSEFLGPATIYSGVFGLFLVMLSWQFRKDWDRRITALFWLGVLALIFSFGKFNPLYLGMIKWSGIYSLRVPARMLFFTGFVLAILAGHGWDRLWERISAPGTIRTSKGFLVLVGLVSVGFLLAGYLVQLFMPFLHEQGTRILKTHFSGNMLHPHAFEFYQQKLRVFLEHLQISLKLDGNPSARIWVLIFSANIIFAVGLVRRYAFFAKPKVLLLAGMILLMGDLYSFHQIADIRFSLRPIHDNQQKDAVFLDPMNKSGQGERLYEFCTSLSQRDEFPLFFNSGLTYGLADIGIYSPLALRAHRDTFAGLGANDNSISLALADQRQAEMLRPLLDMTNTGYVISAEPLPGVGWTQVITDGGYGLYRNEHVLPRTYWLPERSAKYAEDFNAQVRAQLFRPDREMFLHSGPPRVPDGDQAEAPAYRPVGLVEDRSSYKHWRTDFAGPGWVFFSEVHYPGWAAYLDGRKVSIHPANGIFSAVQVPAGRHALEVKYKPFYARVMPVSWLVLALIAGAALLRSRGTKPGPNPSA